MTASGLTGWWNGYFAGRAAPLGPTPPEVVTALFFGFSPSMVARAVPKIWSRIAPEAALEARLSAAEQVLGEHISTGSTDDLRRVTDNLERVVDGLGMDGRALAGAWSAVDRPTGLCRRLWLATTILREHRGDGHVAAATAAGLSGLQASMTHIADGGVTRDMIQANRGWTDAQWDDARGQLVERDILTPAGALTDRGIAVRESIEDTTDRLAAQTVRALPDAEWTLGILTALARALVDREVIPFPNPIGVPRP
nr:hypothetical protein [Gordonia sp. 'Campus']